MNDYIKLKQFWNQSFQNIDEQPIKECWISSRKVNSFFNKYINGKTNVLDYATGSGWLLFECALKCKFNKAIGIDTSDNAIKSNINISKLSGFSNIEFICGDENVLDSYINYFDFASSINLFDVIPDDAIFAILDKIYNSMKKDSYLFIGLNHDFSLKQLSSMPNSKIVNGYVYRDEILRLNKKTTKQWKAIFAKKFEVVESFKFYLYPAEKKYNRVGFLLKKTK